MFFKSSIVSLITLLVVGQFSLSNTINNESKLICPKTIETHPKERTIFLADTIGIVHRGKFITSTDPSGNRPEKLNYLLSYLSKDNIFYCNYLGPNYYASSISFNLNSSEPIKTYQKQFDESLCNSSHPRTPENCALQFKTATTKSYQCPDPEPTLKNFIPSPGGGLSLIAKNTIRANITINECPLIPFISNDNNHQCSTQIGFVLPPRWRPDLNIYGLKAWLGSDIKNPGTVYFLNDNGKSTLYCNYDAGGPHGNPKQVYIDINDGNSCRFRENAMPGKINNCNGKKVKDCILECEDSGDLQMNVRDPSDRPNKALVAASIQLSNPKSTVNCYFYRNSLDCTANNIKVYQVIDDIKITYTYDWDRSCGSGGCNKQCTARINKRLTEFDSYQNPLKGINIDIKSSSSMACIYGEDIDIKAIN